MSLHVTVGCMFSGKTTHALGVLSRSMSIDYDTLMLVPCVQSPPADGSSARMFERCTRLCVPTLHEVRNDPRYASADVVVVEEAHFFSDLKDFCLVAVETDRKHVHVYGLDGTFDRQLFGQLAELLPLADTFEKLTALCSVCRDGTPAQFSFRHQLNNATIVLGGADVYMPLCRRHYLDSTRHRRNVLTLTDSTSVK